MRTSRRTDTQPLRPGHRAARPRRGGGLRFVGALTVLAIAAGACRPAADLPAVPVEAAPTGPTVVEADHRSDGDLIGTSPEIETRDLDLDALADDRLRDELVEVFADVLARGEPIQVATLAEQDPGELPIPPVTLFSTADQADALHRAHDLDLPDQARAVDALVVGPRPQDTRAGSHGGFLDSAAVPPAPPREATGGAEGPIGPHGITTRSVPQITRYVGHDDLPLYAAPDFDAAEVATLRFGERVFVQPELPTVVGDNVFVRVHAPDHAPMFPTGYLPLYWLYESPPSRTADSLTFQTSYGLMSRAVTEAIRATFYTGCDPYPQVAHEQTLYGGIPMFDPSTVASPMARYECGEYPVGWTAYRTLKLLDNHEFTTPAVKQGGTFEVDLEAMTFTVPLRMTRLQGQTRGAPYEIRDLRTGAGGPAKTTSNSLYVPKATPMGASNSAVMYDLPVADDAVRVHGTDAWFNVSFDPPAGVTDEADAYVNLCIRLPGSEVRTGTVHTDIVFTTQGKTKRAKERTSHIQALALGGMVFSPMTVCATATLVEPRGSVTGPHGAADLAAGTPAPLVVRFVRATIDDVTVQHTGILEVFGKLDPVHDWFIGQLTSVINGVLKSDIGGPLLWQGLLKNGLEQTLLTQLDSLAAQLQANLVDPVPMLRQACDTLMPDSFGDVSSRYHLLYRQCRDAGASAGVELIAEVSPNLVQQCHDPEAYARVSEGAVWRSSDDRSIVLTTGSGDHASQVLHRPHWVGCALPSTMSTSVLSDWWPLLRCMEEIVDHDVNHGRTISQMRDRLRNDCQVPAVKLLCDAYGEGADLRAMWSAAHGINPPIGPYAGFCGLYRELTKDPAYQSDLTGG
jgi:hypothetical protein